MAGKIVDVTFRLIDQITSPLSGLNSNLKASATQWTTAGKQIQSAGKSITAVGTSLTKTLTVPIVGAGVASAKLAADFEKGMDAVAAISGETGDSIDMLSQKAKEMGAKTKYSATEASEAYQYMAMAGWDAAEMYDGIEGIMYLAGATGEDLATTSDIVTDSLTAFGMGASDTGRFVDVLAKTAASANTNVSMLGESFQYAAPVAGALGYSVEDMSVALGLMANSGIKASSAGTAMRTWMSNMASPSGEAKKAMDKLGLSITDSEGNMKSLSQVMQDTRGAFDNLSESEKAMYAKALAGKTGMSGLLAIINSSDDDFNSLTKAIQESNGACEEMYNTANDNLSGQLTILKSTLESIGISVGEKLSPYIKKGVGYLQQFAEKVNGLSDDQVSLIVHIAGVVAAVGPMVLVFGKVVGTVGKVAVGIGKFGKLLKTFGSVAGIIASPAGVVIGVLAAIAVATVLVITHWKQIKAAASSAFGYVKGVLEDLGITSESIQEKLSPLGDKFKVIGDKLKELWTVVSPVVSEIGGIFMDVFLVKVGIVVGGAIGYFSSIYNSAVDFIGGLLDVFTGLIDFVTGVFTGNWEKAWTGVKEIFGGIFESLSALVKAPMNAVISLINGAIAGINNLGIVIPDWVPVLGGKAFQLNIPQIPMLYAGTDNWKGGLATINERGGELVDLPRGARVYPHDESVRKAYNDGARAGSMSVVINKIADNMSVRSDLDIDLIAKAIAQRIEEVSNNMGGGEIGYIY